MIDQNTRVIIRKIVEKNVNEYGPSLNQRKKSDGSWVTDLDHALTEDVENFLRKRFPGVPIVSEEGSHNLTFPSFILDPVDGTAGLIKQNGESSLSLAFMSSDDIHDAQNSGYIAHLFSPFEVHDENLNNFEKLQRNNILVSRSEYNAGMFSQYEKHNLELEPTGSIALKLGYLAASRSVAVVSLRPKSIWDIAAGTILLARKTFTFTQGHSSVDTLASIRIQGSMIWAEEEISKNLRKIFV